MVPSSQSALVFGCSELYRIILLSDPAGCHAGPDVFGQSQACVVVCFLTTLTSVLGGMFGYLIGLYAFSAIEPFLRNSHYWEAYQTAVAWFENWGFWAVFVAGFSPIPYKVFTIAAGALSMLWAPFVLASIIGRGARFFLVAGLMAWGGEKMEAALHKYVDRLGWATVGLVGVGLLAYQ